MPVFGEEQRKKRTGPIVNEIVGRVNDNTKRLRLLEDRERLLTSRISSMDESVFEKIKALDERMSGLEAAVQKQDENSATLHNTLKEVIKQLKFLAKKSDVKKIEEKLNLFSPLFSQQAPAETDQQQ
jgi:hypothetical protein